MFFSTTDRKGVILSGNDVFVRVSGYDHGQLIGTPHSIIRHPAMPRAVFRLVWDFLRRDKPVAGLVKNLASDGRHYWVVAFLMPIDGGYLSIRFKPSSPLQPVVEQLYAAMTRCEAEQVAAGGDPARGMDAAQDIMVRALRERGFEDYDAFMRVLLHDELKSRDAQLKAQQLRLFPADLPERDDHDPLWRCLDSIYANGLRSYAHINELYAQLDQFADLNQQLAEKSVFVLGLTKDFRFIAFNAALRSSRLGEEGRSLSVIAEYLSGCSTRTTAAVGDLTTRIEAITQHLRAVIFDLAAARLQIEMVLVFCAELAGSRMKLAEEGEIRRRQRMIEDLQRAFAATVARALRALDELTRDLRALSVNSEEMRRLVLTLQVAQVGGLVEASRLRNDDTFAAMFDDLREGVGKTKTALHEVDEASEELAALANLAPSISATVNQAATEMAQAIDSLGSVRPAAAAPAAAPAPLFAPVPEFSAV